MKDKRWKIIFALCGMIMVLGCNPYQFDQQRYEELVKDDSPVPETDSIHNWMMTASKTLVVDPSGVTDIKLIQIFTDNPSVTESAEIVGGAYSSGDRSGLRHFMLLLLTAKVIIRLHRLNRLHPVVLILPILS